MSTPTKPNAISLAGRKPVQVALATLDAELEKRGVRFGGGVYVVQRTDKGELKLREFKDPDGNSLALMGFVPK